MEVVKARGIGVQSWYLDVNLLANYWGEGARVYHHTAPISMAYALHESLRMVLEEGLEKRWARHEENHSALRAGLDELGLAIASQEGHQLWQLNAVTIPEGVDEASVRGTLLNEHGIEVGPGLGQCLLFLGYVGYSGIGFEASKHRCEAGNLLQDVFSQPSQAVFFLFARVTGTFSLHFSG